MVPAAGIPFYRDALPALTAGQMAEVDRRMVETLQIDLLQMMENAGRCLAHLARARFLGGDPRDQGVVILAGTGCNGGGALAGARRLHNWGARVQVITSRPPAAFRGVPAQQLRTLERMGLAIWPAEAAGQIAEASLVIDGLVGYRLAGPLRGAVAELVRWANAQAAPVLALDVPSGLDSTTGALSDPTVRAAATLTLALPKVGLQAAAAAPFVGELYLADIGVPPALYEGLGLAAPVGPLFAQSDLLRLR